MDLTGRSSCRCDFRRRGLWSLYVPGEKTGESKRRAGETEREIEEEREEEEKARKKAEKKEKEKEEKEAEEQKKKEKELEEQLQKKEEELQKAQEEAEEKEKDTSGSSQKAVRECPQENGGIPRFRLRRSRMHRFLREFPQGIPLNPRCGQHRAGMICGTACSMRYGRNWKQFSLPQNWEA